MAPNKRVLALAFSLQFLPAASGFSSTPPAPSCRVQRRQSSRTTTSLQFSASALLFNRASTKSSESSTTAEPYLPQVNHRHSARDWVHNVRSLPQSIIWREIRNPVLSVVGWSTIVSVLYRVLHASAYHSWRRMAQHMCVGTTAHSFLVSSLGLLLVFRTNSAYQRFAEGRAIWERILTTSRNLSRMMNLYSAELSEDRKLRMTQLLAAFPYLLRHHIRPKCLECSGRNIPAEHRLPLPEAPMEPVQTRHEGDKTNGGSTDPAELGGIANQSRCWVDRRQLPWSLFPDGAIGKVADSRNRPLWTCDRLGREIVSIPYNDNWTSRERLTMLGQVEKLNNAIGECERIHQTAVPLNYARHSLRSLTLWLFTLPFALVKDLGILTGPVMGVIAWLLFGVYQIGHSIEDPFMGTLRLSVLCDAVRQDVLSTSGSRDSAYSLDGDDIADDDWSALGRDEAPRARNEDKKVLLELEEYEQRKLVDLADRAQRGSSVVLETSKLLNTSVDSWSTVEMSP